LNNNVQVLFSLLRNALFNETIDYATQRTAIEKADVIYKIAKHHDVVHLLNNAYEKCDFDSLSEEIKKLIKKKHFVSVIRYERTNYDFEIIKNVFESEHIPFIPLKGSVIRDYYPEPWMRTSCDIDILVHETDVERAAEILVNTCSCEKGKSGTHDVSFCSPNGTHIELHYKLTEIYYESPAEKLIDMVWEYACPKEGKAYHCVLSDEFFYLYHIYHIAKHFEIGGCGIRPFLDLWLLDNKVPHENGKRDSLLEKGGLLKFANSCRELSRFWFSDGQESETVKCLQRFILAGGTYGTSDNRHLVVQAKNDNKLKRVMNVVFLSYDKLIIQYPVVKKHKWMIPFCEVHRWFRVFKPGYGKIAKDELIVSSKPKNESSESFASFLKQIGLKQ